eukprot:scaffold6556_cov106-Isochrysis_galbana.AAC.1
MDASHAASILAASSSEAEAPESMSGRAERGATTACRKQWKHAAKKAREGGWFLRTFHPGLFSAIPAGGGGQGWRSADPRALQTQGVPFRGGRIPFKEPDRNQIQMPASRGLSTTVNDSALCAPDSAHGSGRSQHF